MQVSKTSHEQIKTVSEFLHELSWLNDDLRSTNLEYVDFSPYTILKDFDKKEIQDFLNSVCCHAKNLFYEKVLMNCSTMLDNCADPNLEVLDFNPKIKAGFESIELLREIDNYVTPNPQNYVGFESILHEKIKLVLSKVPVAEVVS